MSVYLLECARSSSREKGTIVLDLDFPDCTIHQAVRYVQDHSYRVKKAESIHSEEELPARPIAIITSRKPRVRHEP